MGMLKPLPTLHEPWNDFGLYDISPNPRCFLIGLMGLKLFIRAVLGFESFGEQEIRIIPYPPVLFGK